jgi:hypothetical protein
MFRTKKNGKHITLKEGQQRKRPAGRKGVYDNDTFPLRAFKLCLLGLNNKELATAFGVSVQGIEKWLRDHPDFRKMVAKGKTEADSEVVHSLYRRAIGYEHDDVDIKAIPGIGVVKTKYRKIYPPDTTAAIFWLKTRTKRNVMPWADITRIEHTGEVHLQQAENIDLKEFTTDELRMLRDCGLKVQAHTNGARNSNNN